MAIEADKTVNNPSKIRIVFIAVVFFISYAVFIDYNAPGAKWKIVRVGMLLLYVYGIANLFGLETIWKFFSKRGAFIGRADLDAFVHRLSLRLAILLMIFIAIAGVYAPSWLEITFNGSDISLESLFAIGVLVRLLSYRGS